MSLHSFFQIKKRCMTLLETLIAMTILSVLLVLVFGLFRELSVINMMTEEKQSEAFKIRYLDSRLSYMFERLVNEKASERIFYFYTEPPNSAFSRYPSLVFTFNNEVRRDPDYSGDVLARLYLNQENELWLLTWPLLVEDPNDYMRKELLATNVVDIKFLFYAAPERLKKGAISVDKVGPGVIQRNWWHENEWLNKGPELKREREMPSIMKIILTFGEGQQGSRRLKEKDDQVTEFAFVLPSSRNPVYYPPEEG